MGILDLHARALESAAADSRLYVPQRQPPAFSVWDAAAAIPRGAVAGIGEMGASAFEVASGLADGMRRLRDATPEQMREYDRVGTLKPDDFRTAFGRAMRDEANSWMPDPATTHASAQVVAEFSRMLGKVAATAPFLGPVGAAGVVGMEEGFTVSDKLAQDGVDLETRSHVGAVTAGITAATFALPIAGDTIKSTAALALGGGPLAYIGQQAATREILNRADYSHLADRYDPFDPVGLALSTLLPLGFGAMGLRAAGKAKAKVAAREAELKAAQEAQTTAQAEADFMAGPVPSEKTAVSRAVDMQMEDAARVSLLDEVSAAHRLTPDTDLAGSAAHDAAMARAMEQIAAREPVNVADLVDPWEGHVNESAAPRAADIADDRRILGKGAGWAQVGGSIVREAPPVERLSEYELRTIHMQGEVVGRTQWIPGEAWFAQMRSDLRGGGLSSPESIQAAIEKAIAGDKLNAKEKRTVEWMAGEVQRMRDELRAFLPDDDAHSLATHGFGEGLGTADAADLRLTAKAAKIDPQRVEDAARMHEDDDAAFLAEMKRIVDEHPENANAGASKGGADVGKSQTFAEFVAKIDKAAREADAETRRLAKRTEAPKAEPATPAKPAPPKQTEVTAAEPEHAQGIARAAADLEAVNPDLLVRLDGMDEAVPMSELMRRVKEEAAADLENAKLVEVAASCALRAA